MLLFCGAKLRFVGTAERTSKLLRQILKLGAGSDAVIGIAERLVVLPSAKVTNIFHNRYLLFYFSAKSRMFILSGALFVHFDELNGIGDKDLIPIAGPVTFLVAPAAVIDVAGEEDKLLVVVVKIVSR